MFLVVLLFLLSWTVNKKATGVQTFVVHCFQEENEHMIYVSLQLEHSHVYFEENASLQCVNDY